MGTKNEVILNEKTYIENALSSKDLGYRPTLTLSLAARLYNENGYSKDTIRHLLEQLILRSDSNASLVKWSKSIDWAVKHSDKKLVQIDSVPITKMELDICKSVNTKQKQRLMFTLFCLAKFGHMVNPKNEGWVNVKDSELFSMANVTTTVRRQSFMLNELMTDHYIQFAKNIDSTSMKVLFMDLTSPPVLQIDDFRNLGNQYSMIIGEPYFKCECCGLTVRRKSNAQHWCQSCGKEINIQKTSSASKLRRLEANGV